MDDEFDQTTNPEEMQGPDPGVQELASEPDAELQKLQEELEQTRSQYTESSQEGRRLHAQLEDERRRAQQLETMLLQQQMNRPDPVQQKHREVLDEAGLTDAVTNLVDSMVNQRVSEHLRPVANAVQMMGRIDMDLPEFAENRGAVNRFLAENPDVRDRYNKLAAGDPVGAADYALLKWQVAQNRKAERQIREGNEVAEAQKQANRPQAGVITARTQRDNPQVEQDQAELKALQESYDYGMETGDMSEYLRTRLKDQLDKIMWSEE